MKPYSAVAFACCALASARATSAQDLPTLDPSAFEIVTIEAGSKAIARSNGRSYLCSIELNETAIYVSVKNCIPFLAGQQAESADEISAKLLKSQVDEVDAAKAKIAAAQAASEAEVATLKDVSEDDFRKAVEKAIRKNDCILQDAKLWNQNDFALNEVWSQLGLQVDFSRPFQAELQRRLVATFKTMESSGAIATLGDGHSIKLKDCN